MAACDCCGQPIEVRDGQTVLICEGCYWSGIMLRRAMPGVFECLEQATGTPWYPEHTGGGCWALTSTVAGRTFMVTECEGPLSWNETVRDVDGAGGWALGVYLADDDGYTIEDDLTVPISTEALPMRAREIATNLRRLEVAAWN